MKLSEAIRLGSMLKPQTFYERRETIEAFQFTEATAAAALFDKRPVPWGLSIGGSYHLAKREVHSASIWVAAARGTYGDGQRARFGDWICRIAGQLLVIDNDSFSARYRKIGSGTDSSQRSELVTGQERSEIKNSQLAAPSVEGAETAPEFIPAPPYCAQRGPDGYECTKPLHHAGEHVATGVSGSEVYARWHPAPSPSAVSGDQRQAETWQEVKLELASAHAVLRTAELADSERINNAVEHILNALALLRLPPPSGSSAEQEKT